MSKLTLSIWLSSVMFTPLALYAGNHQWAKVSLITFVASGVMERGLQPRARISNRRE
ncbi:MAG TPA: hypothetical protein V6D14_26610 [Coleofasciculaceae cyanobacterium]